MTKGYSKGIKNFFIFILAASAFLLVFLSVSDRISYKEEQNETAQFSPSVFWRH